MTLHRRISAGAAALIFFAIFFALPLYAAATLCAMPCCHHGGPGAKLKNDLPGCPGGECTIAADDATVKAVSRYVAPSLVAISRVAMTASTVTPRTAHAETSLSPPRGAPPLHLLNSTFRI